MSADRDTAAKTKNEKCSLDVPQDLAGALLSEGKEWPARRDSNWLTSCSEILENYQITKKSTNISTNKNNAAVCPLKSQARHFSHDIDDDKIFHVIGCCRGSRAVWLARRGGCEAVAVRLFGPCLCSVSSSCQTYVSFRDLAFKFLLCSESARSLPAVGCQVRGTLPKFANTVALTTTLAPAHIRCQAVMLAKSPPHPSTSRSPARPSLVQ